MSLFIRRPVMTTLLMVAILVAGILGYRLLPVSDLPNVDFPTIAVSASLPGASPETMAAAVATPLERQFSTIAGIDNMTSQSSLGSTQVTIQFSLDRDIDAAAQDVQAAIAAVQRQLPADMPTPPSYRKVNPADSPILFIALTSPTLPLSTLDEYGQTLLAPRLSMVGGVAQVLVWGSQKYAVRIQVDPQALASRGIGIDEVVTAVASNNVNLPTGTLWGREKAYTVKASGQLATAAEFRPIVVAWRDGAPVRLEDLGHVLDSVQNDKTAAWRADRRGIMLAVQRQPGTNTVAVTRAVKELLQQLREQLPAAASLDVMIDRSLAIQESVHDVKVTLALTLCLVVLVIFVFLRNIPATVIPSIALPMSVVGTFAVMALANFNLDNLSLMALTLSLGFVVDDAIVMLENIYRHLEQGKAPRQAALDGAREVGFTIVSMTLSLAAVFLPVLFMGGIMGRLFREFAVTIMAAILISGVVSLTLTPMMCSRFLHPSQTLSHGRLYGAIERAWAGSLGAYERGLAFVIRHKFATAMVSFAILAGVILLFGAVPKGFIPSEDTGLLSATTEGAEGLSFEAMVAHQQAAAAVIAADPDVDTFMSNVAGGGGPSASNQGRFFLRLKPRGERESSADEIVGRLRAKLAQIPGLRIFVVNPPAINIGGRGATSLYQFTLQSSDLDALYAAAPALEAKLRESSLLRDVNSDLRISNPEVRVTIDRDRAASLGLTPRAIEDALFSAYGARQISTILAPDNQYYVLLEVMPEYQREPQALDLLHVRARDGDLVPLSALARIDTGVGPLAVNHAGQLPAVTLSFNLADGVSLGEAVAAVTAAAAETLPDGIVTSFAGTAQAFRSSQAGMAGMLLLAIAVIYIVLGILYESFVHPITILTGLPFALFGALLTLMVFGSDLNLYSYVGLLMLIGVVKKNAIMMIDFALEAKKTGLGAEQAILQACSVRFRPIMMTTLAALVGTLPIALGLGAGAESRRPLGLAVVGGLLFSQLVTLFVTPVFFTYLDRFQSWAGRRSWRRGAARVAD
ncbi:MAG TPA: efflux RND transporter permease subunit [Candidatus Krumholzibacteria bacterium]|nr:efflux RND transporter permease subunit [Candidatus Krumholzibacteria bacterium]HPD70362.1 efflux RND transporter permease subunit [Candidatus Krumholzibacteria bacterium]HRY39938.1 efflux RND transporter permease subunit [Candidatus Krumholzibacteria bacterium]